MVAYWSSLLTLLTLLRGYLGFFGNLKVLGRLNVAVVLTLRDFLSWTPDKREIDYVRKRHVTIMLIKYITLILFILYAIITSFMQVTFRTEMTYYQETN